jgi:hypothetical protein
MAWINAIATKGGRMSIRHPDLVDLVERLASGDPLSDAEREWLGGYLDDVRDDQLDRRTVEALEELTGRTDVWTPRLAARALLATH